MSDLKKEALNLPDSMRSKMVVISREEIDMPVILELSKAQGNKALSIKGIKRPGVPRDLLEKTMTWALADVFGFGAHAQMSLYYFDVKKMQAQFGLALDITEDSVSILYEDPVRVPIMSLEVMKRRLALRVRKRYLEFT